jgi:hypothetical protein
MRTLCVVVLLMCGAATMPAFAAGPFGSIHVGNWNGGGFTNDQTGAFSHCSAATSYANGVNLLVGQNALGNWILGFGSPAFRLNQGETFPIDVTFDGQSQFHLFGTAVNSTLVTSILPGNALVDQLKKAHFMVAVGKGTTLQFSLDSTGRLLPVIANCVAKIKSAGLASAGDFSVLPPPPKPAPKPVVQSTVAATPPAAATPPTSPTAPVLCTSLCRKCAASCDCSWAGITGVLPAARRGAITRSSASKALSANRISTFICGSSASAPSRSCA